LEKFYKGNDKQGLSYKCKQCIKDYQALNKERENLRSKQWKLNNPDKAKASHRKYRFRLTPEQFNKMLVACDNKCQICRREFTLEDKDSTPHIDHDHSCCPGIKTCGECVRGLLCGPCNLLCGIADDNPAIFNQAIKYLQPNDIVLRLLDNPGG
jgi:hypothetical protein